MIRSTTDKIHSAIDCFKLNLKNKTVLTEAATGNFVVTPIIAACAGANVYAYTRNSQYGSVSEVKKQTNVLAKSLGVIKQIVVTDKMEDIPFSEIDIVTNTGFLRPINKIFIEKLSSKCVIPLMWEPWEYRPDELDIDACVEKGIKVYGTNESDERLKTMDYIGYIILYWLLAKKISPFSGKILVVGTDKFVTPIANVLHSNNYFFDVIQNYANKPKVSNYNCIVIAEYKTDDLIIGDNKALIQNTETQNHLIIHISGNIKLKEYSNCIPVKPKNIPYMSFTTDFIDNKAVIDLHTAGLKVGEGMVVAKKKKLIGVEFKKFMETHYPALAFDNNKYW